MILIRKSTDFTKVLHGYGLSAGRVVRNGNDDKRYTVSMLLQCFFQFHRIDIAFKRYFQLSIFRFIDGAIQSNGPWWYQSESYPEQYLPHVPGKRKAHSRLHVPDGWE